MPSIKNIKISKLRNIESADLDLNSQFNIFYGANGAGKTSFLEAFYLLSTSRSFRSHKSQYLVNYEAEEAVVSATLARKFEEEFVAERLGIAKPKSGRCDVRIDGRTSLVASELARLLPVIAIDPGSFQFLEGGPQIRRTILDWLVFHVKPKFFQAFKDYRRCLKQRNILLRSDKISRFDLVQWDKLLCESAVVIDSARAEAAHALAQQVSLAYTEENDGLDIDISYKTGWGELSENELEAKTYEQYLHKLEQCFDRDRKLGYTSVGSHKFDLSVKARGKPATEILSRGQKKQLVICFFLAAARIYKGSREQYPILLLDDLPSELDKDKLSWLLKSIKELGAQTCVTSIEPLNIHELIEIEQTDASWFHVKHGSAMTKHDFGNT